MRKFERRPVVVHVFGSMDPGGAELRTRALVARVPEARHIFVTLSGRAGRLAADLESQGASVVPMQLRSWTFAGKFVRLLRSEKVDVAHSNVATFSGVLL